MKATVIIETTPDENGGHKATVRHFLSHTVLFTSKHHASEPGAVHAAKVWANDHYPNAPIRVYLAITA